MNGDKMELTFSPADMNFPMNFDLTVLVARYANKTLVTFDKTPNKGHYNFQEGTLIAVPEFRATLLVALAALTISCVLTYSSKRSRKLEF